MGWSVFQENDVTIQEWWDCPSHKVHVNWCHWTQRKKCVKKIIILKLNCDHPLLRSPLYKGHIEPSCIKRSPLYDTLYMGGHYTLISLSVIPRYVYIYFCIIIITLVGPTKA